jgi:heat shock protein HslJ
VFAGSLPDAAQGDWELTDGTVDGQALQVPAGVRITLSIDGDEVGGNNSCNSYFGRVDTSGGRLSITELGQTEMGCPDLMDLEAAYMAALQAVTALEVDGDDLHLTGPEVDLRFARVQPLPTSDLTGTTWTLESLITGDAVSSVGGDPATLELTEDGLASIVENRLTVTSSGDQTQGLDYRAG